MAYKLFTDAGARIVGDKHWVSLAGVVLDHDNYPIAEFLLLQEHKYAREIEVAALMHGLDLIKQFFEFEGIDKWEVYSDSRGSVKKMQGDARKIPAELSEKIAALNMAGCTMTFAHVGRKMNTYANALANYHYNCHMFGDKAKGIHGVNRAKRVFFARLKAGYAVNIPAGSRILSVEKQIEDLMIQLEKLVKMEPHPIRLKRIEKVQSILSRLGKSVHISHEKEVIVVSQVRICSSE